MWQRPRMAAGFDAVSRYGSSCTTVRFLRILRGFLVKQSPGVPKRWAKIGLRPKWIEDLTNHRKLLVPKIAEVFGIQNLPMFCCIFALIPSNSHPSSWVNMSSPRGPFGGYFGRDWKWSSPEVARQASRSPQKAHQELPLKWWTDGLLGHPQNANIFRHTHIPKMPRLTFQGVKVWSGSCFIQLCFSPASAQLRKCSAPLIFWLVVSYKDTPLFSETTLQKSSETERYIPKPEVIFRNYVGFRNLFLLYWEINTTGSTNTVQQLHGLAFISGLFRVVRPDVQPVTSHRPWRTSLGVLSQSSCPTKNIRKLIAWSTRAVA